MTTHDPFGPDARYTINFKGFDTLPMLVDGRKAKMALLAKQNGETIELRGSFYEARSIESVVRNKSHEETPVRLTSRGASLEEIIQQTEKAIEENPSLEGIMRPQLEKMKARRNKD